MKLNQHKILIVSFLFFVLVILCFGYFEFSKNKSNLYANVDQSLYACAKNADLLLGDSFFEQATKLNSISQKQDFENIQKLSRLAENCDVVYVYSMIFKNDNIHFVSSSATKEELASGHNLTKYFDIYDDASFELREAFASKKIVKSEYTDKWGTFRSVFVPKVTKNGDVYVLGADMELGEINKKLREDFFWLSIKVISILFFGLLLFLWQLLKANKTLSDANHILDEQQIRLNQQVEHLKISKSKIKEKSLIDELTQIPNRKSYNHKLDESFARYLKYQEPFCVAMFDLDNFKIINDTYGHHIGDVVLQKISQKVASTIRSSDFVFRVGGEEFVIILTNTTIEDAFLIAQRVRLEVERMNIIDGKTITVSVGVAQANKDDDAEILYRRVDQLMYQAKQSGKNMVIKQ